MTVGAPPRRPRPRPPGDRPHPRIADRRRAVRRRRRAGNARLVAVLGGCLGCGLLGHWLATGPVLTARGVHVAGYDRADAAQLDAALEAAAGRGGSLLAPPVGAMRRAAVRFPWVADIVVRRDLPAGLAVQVIPAEPAAIAVPPEGAPAFVSRAGLVMGPAGDARGLPRLRLAGPVPPPGAALPRGARAPLAFVLALEPEVAGRIRALRVEGGRVLGRYGRVEVRLGAPVQMAAKAAALEAVVAGVAPGEVAVADYIELSEPLHPALGGLEPGDGAGDDAGDAAAGSADAAGAGDPTGAADPADGAPDPSADAADPGGDGAPSPGSDEPAGDGVEQEDSTSTTG